MTTSFDDFVLFKDDAIPNPDFAPTLVKEPEPDKQIENTAIKNNAAADRVAAIDDELDREEDDNDIEEFNNEEEENDGNDYYTPLAKLIAESRGYDIEDLSVDPSVEGLMGMINDIIQDEAVPQYSSETVKLFDEYVKKGGDPSRFLKAYYPESSYEKFEPKTEEDKKMILRDHYKNNLGLSDRKINTLIEDAIDTDTIDDEVKETLAELRAIESESKKQVIQQQEAQLRQRQQQQEKFRDDTMSYIDNSAKIAELPVSNDEKKLFKRFLFEEDNDGHTPYQKIIALDQNVNIELAYLLFQKVKNSSFTKNARTEIAREFASKLSSNKRNSGMNGNRRVEEKQTKGTQYDKFII